MVPLQRQKKATHNEFLDEDDGPMVDNLILILIFLLFLF
jgi:hypothetical protein